MRQDDRRLTREWIQSNGRGGYALGNDALARTRRYHGLLVAACPAPHGRVMMVPRVEEVLEFGDERLDIGTAFYAPGEDPPLGLGQVLRFERGACMRWTLELAGRLLVRELRQRDTVQGVHVQWKLIEGDPARLLVRPLLAGRSHHELLREGDYAVQVEERADGLAWRRRPGAPLVHVAHDGERTEDPACFYRDIHLPEERRRGYDHVEDLHAPLRIAYDLEPGGKPASLFLTAPEAPGAKAVRPGLGEEFVVVHPGGEPGIIAGYPWFTEWARDTMLSLPGLLLSRGRVGAAFDILLRWAERVEGGLLPNRLEEAGTDPDHNSADAPLLFVRALEQTRAAAPTSEDRTLEAYPAVRAILRSYLEGARYGIGIASDGLLHARAEGRALTWMDAIVPGQGPATPRDGAPIELQALLHRALRFGASLAEERGASDDAAAWSHAAGALGQAIRKHALDAVTGLVRDDLSEAARARPFELRPNALFLLALAPELLTEAQRRHHLDRTRAELWTPYGLRTLSPFHADYQGVYEGDQVARDGAYHQGTVWPWLMAPWIAASLSVSSSPARLSALRQDLRILSELHADLGTLPEVFDGDAPHLAGGTPAQAWSVAALLEASSALETVS